MTCPGCSQENPAGVRFCGGCGARSRRDLRRLPGAEPAGQSLLPPVRRRARAGRRRRPVRVAPVLHAEAPGREDPHHGQRAQGRAQAGDGALRGRLGVHLAVRASRPRGSPPAHEPRLRPHAGRGAPLRGHGQPVPRRRHHGALRRPHRPRGPRAPGRPRGARHRTGARDLSDRAGSARHQLPRPPGAQHRPRRGRQHRQRPAHGLHGRRRHHQRRGASAAGGRAGARDDLGGDPSSRPRLLRDAAARRASPQGQGRVHRRVGGCAPRTRRARASRWRPTGGLTPFVGRERELAALVDAFERARAGQGQVAFLVGEAGIGKSRLLLELRRRVGRRRGLAGGPLPVVREGHGLPSAGGPPPAPVRRRGGRRGGGHRREDRARSDGRRRGPRPGRPLSARAAVRRSGRCRRAGHEPRPAAG